MRIGIITEGHADRAVISNIIKGITGLDFSDMVPLRPIYNLDETDKASLKPENFSSWSIIKEECESKELIESFLALEDQSFVAIHIDSAESNHYGVSRPTIPKSDLYCDELRNLIITQINKWLNDDSLHEQLLYAIAIEEIDAWILTIYEAKKTCDSVSPKEKLSRILGKKNIDSTSNYDNYLSLSKPFTKQKEIRKGDFLSFNCSLNAFCNEVEKKILPLLIN